jgi:hypothetical protein
MAKLVASLAILPYTCEKLEKRKTMYMVYWSAVHEDGLEAKSRTFTGELLEEPLAFVRELRREGDETGKIRFVIMCSENPNSVGKPGAEMAGPEYDWTKRRGGSNRPSGDVSHTKDH